MSKNGRNGSTAEFLTAEDVGKLLGLGYRTVLELAESGELPGKRLGRQWRFSRDALAQHLGYIPAVQIEYTARDGVTRRPCRGYPGDAGYDLYAANEISIPSGFKAEVHTGVRVKIPKGFHARIVPRSSTFVKHDLWVHDGTIDSDFTGDLTIWVRNFSVNDFKVPEGQHIAQLILYRTIDIEWVEVEELSPVKPEERGPRMIGSTDHNR